MLRNAFAPRTASGDRDWDATGASRFEEKLLVDKPHVHLLGAGRDDSIITWSDTGDSPGLDGLPLGTHGSWSVKVSAPGFSARSVTFENAFDYEANRALSDDANQTAAFSPI